MKVSLGNSAAGSFCWNYATGTFYDSYASDNVCCIFAGLVLYVTGMLVNFSVKIMQVAIIQLEVSAVHMQVTVSAASMQMAIFIVIKIRYFLQCLMHMTVSIVIMQGTLSLKLCR